MGYMEKYEFRKLEFYVQYDKSVPESEIWDNKWSNENVYTIFIPKLDLNIQRGIEVYLNESLVIPTRLLQIPKCTKIYTFNKQ